MAQMVRAMRAIMSMESLGNNSVAASSSQSREDEGRKPELNFRHSTSAEDIDALEVKKKTPLPPCSGSTMHLWA